MDLVVDRSKWVRGDKARAALLNEHGMCCLGFCAIALGFRPEEIRMRGEPACVDDGPDEPPEWFAVLVESDDEERDGRRSYEDGPIVWPAIRINDDEDIDDTEREAELIELFASHGVALSFVDGEGA